MRGNAVLVSLVACLFFPAPIRVDAQNQPGGRIIVNQGAIQFNAQGGFQYIGQAPAAPVNPTAFVPPTGDLLQFVDGSLMHGELKGVDTASGLRWESPAAKLPIDFQPAHVDSIRFAHAADVALVPTSHLSFVNGDDLFGSVTSMDDDHLVFSTWFGGAVTIRRASLQTVTMLSSNYTILYEGPGDTNDWIIGNHNPDSWTLLDGTFISGGPGTLGRDFDLSGSSTVDFDLAWSDIFELFVYLYSDAVDHADMANSYVLEFTRDQVNFHYVDSSHQFPFRTFGSVPLPNPGHKSKVRITIQSNKEEGTVAVFVDNILAKRWKDENGFNPKGGGLLFQQTGMTGATIKLSNFRISQWEGRFEPAVSGVSTNVDLIRFINHDQAAGKITGIDGGKVTLAMADTILNIPLQRVTQINFATAPVADAARGPWEVRAHIPHGGSLSFQMEKWNDKEVSGKSAVFGPLALQPGQIRQLEFNLDHVKPSTPVVTDKEFESLDQ